MQQSYATRRYPITAIMMLTVLVLCTKLFLIQVLDDRYVMYANRNVLRIQVTYPERGVIVDRNGRLLAGNQTVYDIMAVPSQVRPFDTATLCKLLSIDKQGLLQRLRKAATYSFSQPSVIFKQLPAASFASLQERLAEFPGFYAQTRYIRTYPDSLAAQFLGFIGEVNQQQINQSSGYYHPGDYIGQSGVEKSYEHALKGSRGVEELLVDARNVPRGHYNNGTNDTMAVPGKQLISSLDSRIQQFGEQLMHNKLGSIVAIEPETGEVLCFVSSPAYDPNELTGKDRGNNFSKLHDDPNDPFLIRPIQAYYPPGSSFKPLNALIALQEGIINPATAYFCPAYYQAGNHRVNDEHFNGWTNLTKGIAMSSNTYFCIVFHKLMEQGGRKDFRQVFSDWKSRVNRFGLGGKLNIDLPSEKKGNIPSADYFDHQFGKRKWGSDAVISLAIGQGELLATPLQMANVECIMANKGFYYQPHMIKIIAPDAEKNRDLSKRHYAGIDSAYYKPVIDGMEEVVDQGTASGSRISGIVMCGKTGTVQNPHGRNHSVFVAFAPRDHPKIAIAVVVENAGYGAACAAPIASFIVEKYLRGTISSRPSGLTPDLLEKQEFLPQGR